jgi:hypothetical protein
MGTAREEGERSAKRISHAQTVRFWAVWTRPRILRRPLEGPDLLLGEVPQDHERRERR